MLPRRQEQPDDQTSRHQRPVHSAPDQLGLLTGLWLLLFNYFMTLLTYKDKNVQVFSSEKLPNLLSLSDESAQYGPSRRRPRAY